MTLPRIRFEHCSSWLYDENNIILAVCFNPFRNPKAGKGATLYIFIYKYCFNISFILDYKKYDARFKSSRR